MLLLLLTTFHAMLRFMIVILRDCLLHIMVGYKLNLMSINYLARMLQSWTTDASDYNYLTKPMLLVHMLNDQLWSAECMQQPCVTAFVTSHCHFCQKWSGDYGSMISYPKPVGLKSDHDEAAHEEVHSLRGDNQGTVHQVQGHELVILDAKPTHPGARQQ